MGQCNSNFGFEMEIIKNGKWNCNFEFEMEISKNGKMEFKIQI